MKHTSSPSSASSESNSIQLLLMVLSFGFLPTFASMEVHKDGLSTFTWHGYDKYFVWAYDGNEHLNFPSFIASVAAAFLASSLVLRYILNGKGNRRLPPFAPIGPREIMSKSNAEMYWIFLELTRSFGTVMRLQINPLRQIYIVADVPTARAILTDTSSIKPPVYRKLDIVVDGKHVPHLTSKGGLMWKDTRKSVAPAFAAQHVKRMKSVCLDELDEWIRDTIDPEQGSSIDIFREMTKLTLRIISKAAFEYDISEKQMDLFMDETDIFLYEVLYMQRVFPWRKWCKHIIPSVRRGYEASEKLSNFSKEVLASYREKVGQGVESNENTLIKILENSNALKTEGEKISEIAAFFIAGFESAGHTMAWTLLELAKNPSIVQEYRREIEGMSSVYDWANTDCLRRIVREGLRLHPAVIVGSTRKVVKDIHTKSSKGAPGFLIPKGATVWVPYLPIHRSPDYYSNPDTFDPSRWINPSKEAMDALMPFSVGRRNCVGQSLANAEIHSVVARLAAEYDFEVKKEGPINADCLTLNAKGTWLIAKKKAEFLG